MLFASAKLASRALPRGVSSNIGSRRLASSLGLKETLQEVIPPKQEQLKKFVSAMDGFGIYLYC